MTVFKGITNTFDNNGNLTSDGVRTFKYDAFNRIIQVKVGAVVLANYQYDAFNRRVLKQVDADLNGSFETTVKFLYDGSRCIEELNASDALTKEYVYGSLYIDEVILQRTGATDYYFTHDYRYSVTSLTDLIGNTVANYEYKVYGERTSSVNGITDFGYTGQRHDSETGFMYFKNRYYSVSMGSFVTRDPLGYVDGMSMYLGYFGAKGVDPMGYYEDEELEFVDGEGDSKWDPNEKTEVLASLRKVNVRLIVLMKQLRDIQKKIPKSKCFSELNYRLRNLMTLFKDMKADFDSISLNMNFKKAHLGKDIKNNLHAHSWQGIFGTDNTIEFNIDIYFSKGYSEKERSMMHELVHMQDPLGVDKDKSVTPWESPHSIELLMEQDIEKWKIYGDEKDKAELCFHKKECDKFTIRRQKLDYIDEFNSLPENEKALRMPLIEPDTDLGRSVFLRDGGIIIYPR